MSREISQKTLDICSAYRAAIDRGDQQCRIVADLADRYDVQRPAIFRALRSGGALPPYSPQREGGPGRPLGGGMFGYTARRREKSVALRRLTIAEIEAMPRVDRDPCPRCGVRADLGCNHTRAPVGMSFR